MFKTSEISANVIVKELLNSDLGFILVQSDTNVDILSLLSARSSYKDKQGVYGEDAHLTYHLYPIMYHKSYNSKSSYTEERNNAIANIFARWTAKGYNKYYAKDPYNCKAFIKYLEDIEWCKTDYMLLMVNN